MSQISWQMCDIFEVSNRIRDSFLAKLTSVMSLEAMDDASIEWLDPGSKLWFEKK